MFFRNSSTRIGHITDGTSNTALFAEIKKGPNSLRGSLEVVLLGDGSVRFASESIDGDVWRAVGTTSNGEVVGEF